MEVRPKIEKYSASRFFSHFLKLADKEPWVTWHWRMRSKVRIQLAIQVNSWIWPAMRLKPHFIFKPAVILPSWFERRFRVFFGGICLVIFENKGEIYLIDEVDGSMYYPRPAGHAVKFNLYVMFSCQNSILVWNARHDFSQSVKIDSGKWKWSH